MDPRRAEEGGVDDLVLVDQGGASEPLLLSPEEEALWKPPERHWTEYLGAAPGQKSPS